MGYANGIMTEPIGWGDISNALGVGGPPYVMGNMVNASTIINKWAKHKPFEPIIASPDYATHALRDAAALAVDWGLTIPLYSPGSDFHTNWQTEWPYTRPSTWWRALDLHRYADSAYMNKTTGFSGSGDKISSDNLINFPMGGKLMVPDPSAIENGSNSFPMWINQHNSDDYILAPSDFAGATGNNSVVNGTRVDLSKMYFGLAAIYRGSGSNAYTYDKVWVGTTALTSTQQVGYYPSDLTVVQYGNYYLVPILADAHTNGAWLSATSTNITKMCSIDGYAMAVSIVEVVRELTIKGGYSQGSSTSSRAFFNFYVKNAFALGVSITALRCYVIAEATYQNSTYESTFSTLRSDIEAGQDPQANVSVNGNVVARYFNLLSKLTNTSPTSGVEQSFQQEIGAVSDGLGNPYNVLSCILLYVQYSVSGGTSTRELREIYYRNGNIITD